MRTVDFSRTPGLPVDATGTSLPRPAPRGGSGRPMASARRRAPSDILGTSLVVAALLAAIMLPALMASSAIYVLAAVAIVGIASLGGRLAMTARDGFRGRVATKDATGSTT